MASEKKLCAHKITQANKARFHNKPFLWIGFEMVSYQLNLSNNSQQIILNNHLAHLCDFVETNYSGDLNTGLVWYSNGQKLSDHRMVCYSNAI